MSRWLNNVGALLEKLDDRVETELEERAANIEDDNEGIPPSASLEGILAKRGLALLAATDSKDEDDDDKNRKETSDEQLEEPTDIEQENAVATSTKSPAENHLQKAEVDTTGEGKDNNVASESSGTSNKSDEDTANVTSETKQQSKLTTNPVASSSPNQRVDPKPAISATRSVPSTPTRTKQSTPSKPSTPVARPPPSGTPNRSQKEKQLTLDMKEAQKEARTLRRHVVSLNEQLEGAENELQAQRQELERAAERMEKDRVRTKEEKTAFQKRHDQEVALLKAQNETTLKEQQARFETQLEGYKKRLAEENKRKQEGGDMNKEIAQAIDREQDMRSAVSALEEEKAVLLSQISTLQGQQTVLGSRLESLTQAADNAMEREREAEDRLDTLLNQHARQISQRQAREAELERTVQDLNAALVASRGTTPDRNSSAGNATGDVSLQARVQGLEADLETANSYLALEKERSETLQMQLKDLSKETTNDVTLLHQKQLQAERRIAELQLTISRLENAARDAEKSTPRASATTVPSAQGEEMQNQIKLLSEEVVRLRDKMANQNSESLAMKHRLKSAVDRANKLENDLSNAQSSNGNGDVYDTMERAQLSRRRRPGAANTGSIRAAMRLDSASGDKSERIGQVVDVVDSFAVSTGKYLRRNPLARAGFIFYLMLVHLWCFVILAYHSHSMDMGGGIPHGPHAMVMQQQQLVNPVTAVKESPAETNPLLRKPDVISPEAGDVGKTTEDAGGDAKAGDKIEKDTGGT